MEQSRSDGVSRVSNAFRPTAERGPPKEKIYTFFDILYNLPKAGKSKFFDALLTGPREPRPYYQGIP
jgi:hypothetical protein